MNDHITEPFTWDDVRTWDRGKLLTSAQLEKIYAAMANGNGERPLPGVLELDALTNDNGAPEPPLEQFRGKFGRYLDIDDDGIPYRTIPGVHATKGAFVTRGSSRDEYAAYTEDSEAYVRNMERLTKKWATAKELVPQPVFYAGRNVSDDDGNVNDGMIFFGTSTDSALEALDLLAEEGVYLDGMRPLAFPFGKAFEDFVATHDRIFVIEQNRDAQFKTLMMIELGVNPAKLISVLNFDGMPITADNIYRQIRKEVIQDKDR